MPEATDSYHTEVWVYLGNEYSARDKKLFSLWAALDNQAEVSTYPKVTGKAPGSTWELEVRSDRRAARIYHGTYRGMLEDDKRVAELRLRHKAAAAQHSLGREVAKERSEIHNIGQLTLEEVRDMMFVSRGPRRVAILAALLNYLGA